MERLVIADPSTMHAATQTANAGNSRAARWAANRLGGRRAALVVMSRPLITKNAPTAKVPSVTPPVVFSRGSTYPVRAKECDTSTAVAASKRIVSNALLRECAAPSVARVWADCGFVIRRLPRAGGDGLGKGPSLKAIRGWHGVCAGLESSLQCP